jgi:phage terminase small subunit
MPALKNQRHEKFVLALFEGATATEAYIAAGYKPCRKNAARLTTFDDIKARLSELQNAVAKKTEVTVESLLAELEQARSRADGLDQLSAAVKAISEKAKISGLLVQKIEVGPAGAFDDAETIEDVIEAACKQYTEQGYSFDDDDKARLGELLERYAVEEREFLASCKAKPINSIDLRAQELRERQRMGLARPGNGSQHRFLTASNGK